MSFQEYAESTFREHRLGAINPKLVIGILILAIAIVLLVGYTLFQNTTAEPAFQIESNASSSASEAATENPPAKICVHVGGCVASPGIVYLEEGSRVADAIASAGGMTEAASADSVNLARPVTDGEQIIIADSTTTSDPQNDPSQNSDTTAENSKVNINTATSEELQTLNGIGESKAQKIIDHREKNGLFKTIDELTNVSGIGSKTLESLRDSICV